jgi:hypothetical protein
LATDKYSALITSQHQKPNFTAWLSAVLGKADAGEAVLNAFTEEFDIDTAVGAQLDMIGDIVGLSRKLAFQPANGDPVLSDTDYRLCLLAKIAKNQWDGTIQHIYKLWGDLGIELGLNLIDNQNMTMTVKLTGALTSSQKDLVAAGLVVPKPQTVGVAYEMPSGKNTLPMYTGVGTVQQIWYETKM